MDRPGSEITFDRSDEEKIMSHMLMRAVIRSGQVDLPDGSEVEVSRLSPANSADLDDEMSPSEITRILAAMDRMESVAWTEAERTTWEGERQARKAWEKSQFNDRAEKLTKNFE